MKLKLIFPALLLAVALHAGAMSCAMGGADAPPKFMVSVLLQKPGADVTIKLAHALETAATPESATARVLRQVEKTFPGYLVVNTLATRVEDAPACQRPTAKPSAATAI